MSRGESGFVASTGMFCPKKKPQDSCLGQRQPHGGPYWLRGWEADYKEGYLGPVKATAENGRD